MCGLIINVKWPWLGCGPGGSTKNMKMIEVNIYSHIETLQLMGYLPAPGLRQSGCLIYFFIALGKTVAHWNRLYGRKIQFCVASLISFSYNKKLLMRKMELRDRENFVNKIIALLIFTKTMIFNP